MSIKHTAKRTALGLFLFCAALSQAASDEGLKGQPEPDPAAVPVPQSTAPNLTPGPLSAPPSAVSVLPALTPLEIPPPPPRTAESLRPEFELQFAISPLYYNYGEIVPSPLKSTETGVLLATGLYLTHYSGSEMLRAGLDIATGSTNYDGTTQTGTPVAGSTSDTMVDIELNYGYVFWKIDEVSRLRFYAGISGRYWKRFGQYREDYTWYDIPLGIRYENDASTDFGWDIDFSVKPTFGGSIKVYFSGYDSSLQDSTGLLGSDVGAKLKVPIYFFRQSFLPLVVTPWLEYVSFSQGPDFPIESTGGTLQGTAFEPASHAFRLGVYFGTAFGF
jgi:hypothetical protein